MHDVTVTILNKHAGGVVMAIADWLQENIGPGKMDRQVQYDSSKHCWQACDATDTPPKDAIQIVLSFDDPAHAATAKTYFDGKYDV